MRDADAPAPVEAAPKDRPEAIGPALRAARKSRGISLEQISERLRIEPRSLVALEEERFEALGAPVFVKGYLKLYSNYLGLDTPRLLDIYRAGHEGDEPVVQARRSLQGKEQRPTSLWIAAAGAAVLVAAVLWLLRGPEVNATVEAGTTAVDAESAEPGPEGDAAAVVPQPLRPNAERLRPAVPNASQRSSAEPPAAASGAAAGAIEPELDSGGSTDPAAPVDADVSAIETTAIIPPAAAGELAIALRFIEDSWAEIVDGRDARLFYGLGRAGAAARFSAASPVSVLFGNADGVVLEVDGETFLYPENSRRGRLARFTLSTPAE